MARIRILLACVIASACVGVGGQEAPRHDKAFWRYIAAHEYAVPPGESADALASELAGYLGSPDPELRDGIAYNVLAAWIARKPVLSDTTIRSLVETSLGNLRKGIGEPGDERVYGRSFSALSLSIVAARQNARPFLTGEERARLLDGALGYLRDEHDLRDYDPAHGWIHATAHTADLLKFLARDPAFTTTDQARVVEAIAGKLAQADRPFTHGEDERLARALLSIVRRADFDRGPLDRWAGALAADHKALWEHDPLDPLAYLRVQNQKNALKSLVALLEAEESAPPAVADFRRQMAVRLAPLL